MAEHSLHDGQKNIYEAEIGFKDLIIDKHEIISSLGYTDGMLPDHFNTMIEQIMDRLPEYCSVHAGYCILDVQKREDRRDGLQIGGSFFTLQRIVTSHLRKSEKAVLFVCTIGSGMETWVKTLSSEGDGAMSYLADTVASVAVEQAADVLHEMIKDRMQTVGFKITNRYSPGYCDWSVSEQRLLFSFFPDHFCGITLTDSSLMIPIKSVSGIIGAGKEVRHVEYMCNTCGMKDCTYRSHRRKKIQIAH